MGYYSYFELEVFNEKYEMIEGEEKIKIIDHFRNESEEAFNALDFNGDTHIDTTWYDLEKDLADFSAKYPDMLFEMYCEGEESYDLSKMFAKNGKSYSRMAEIIFPDFDEDLLQEPARNEDEVPL